MQTLLKSGSLLLSRVTAALLVLLVFGSLVPPVHSSVPDWVTNPDRDYPPETYLTAVGSAPSLSAAKQKAKTGLSQIFSQRIEAVDQLDQRVEETTRGGTSTFVEKVRQRTEITVKTSAELLGVRIGKAEEVFRNGRSTSYALAVLNKDEAASLYRDRYRENRRQLRESYGAAQEASDPIRRLRLLAEARNVGETARRYRNQYAVLASLGAEANRATNSLDRDKLRKTARDFARRMEENLESETDSSGGSLTGAVPDLPEIERQIDELMAQLRLQMPVPEAGGVFAGTDFLNRFQASIEEQFTRLGFRTGTGTENPDLVVRSFLTAESTTKGRKSDSALRWEVTLRINTPRPERTVGTISNSSTTVGLDDAMARSRTRDAIVSWIDENLSDLIVDKLLST